MDIIFIRNPYPKDFSCLVYCNTFGKEIDFHTNLTTSDHWGVFCDLDFIQKILADYILLIRKTKSNELIFFYGIESQQKEYI